MKKSTMIFTAAILLISGFTFAEAQDPANGPDIDLGGGIARPSHVATITLERLAQGTTSFTN
jgi:hypothetical protein